jgi:predicted nuclease of predicted toxin-antitoxin system
MRFLADENVSKLVITRLRESGFEVLSIKETSSGAPDKDVLAKADSEDCILITEDRDFGELVVRQRLGVRGIILLELDRVSNIAEANLVAGLISTHGDKFLGNLTVLEPARIRIRPLPADA